MLEERGWVEEIGNPDIYADMLGEVVCNNSRIRNRKAEDISEENDCLGPPAPWYRSPALG
jgi:hypothetical protein